MPVTSFWFLFLLQKFVFWSPLQLFPAAVSSIGWNFIATLTMGGGRK